MVAVSGRRKPLAPQKKYRSHAPILVIGCDPDSVGFSDPGAPSGLDRNKIWTGARESLKRITGHGWVATQCMVKPDATSSKDVAGALSATAYDCIATGAGVRLAYNNVPVFESIIEAIRSRAVMDTGSQTCRGAICYFGKLYAS